MAAAAIRSEQIHGVWEPGDLLRRDTCPVCDHATDNDAVARRADGLSLRRCPRCELLYVDPVPRQAALAGCYDGDYYTGVSHGQRRVGYETARPDSRLAGAVEPLCYADLVANFDFKNKTVLEVGCADGALLAKLRALDPSRLTGVDISAAAVARGRSLHNLDLRCGQLRAAEVGESQFDLVVMIDVIEHVIELKDLFCEAARCLKPGGAMFVATPNANSASSGKDGWPYLYRALEHVAYPSIQSISRLAEMNNLVIEKFWTDGIPVVLESYRQVGSGRLARMALEPAVAARNGWRRWKYRNTVKLNSGLDLRVILRRVQRG